ncbi:MAG TPA: hypothetical protein GX702_13610 [Chloroflexi bacterium]|jgi:hypothetical protein|nr:hypothetical protein [Chloroflexota bacterium]
MHQRCIDSRRRAFLGMLSQIDLFSRRVLRRPLRGYQLAPARAIVDSVIRRRGLTFAVMMARQAGKNETAAHVEALLLNYYRRSGGTLIKASPTFRPQALNSAHRLTAVFEGSLLPLPIREQGYMLRVGRARAVFLSAAASANVVGATASILLEADEAQDVDEAKWDKDFRPMGASTNVTTVLWGTAWTSNTLLARTIRALRWAEQRDGVRRVFVVPWQQVAAEVPVYGRYVRGEIERLGQSHPLIRTQYELQTIDAEAGMFPPATRALMQGSHSRQRGPTEGREYALLVDVAGESEDRMESDLLRAREPRKDSTAVTVVEIVRGEMGLSRYLVMDRYWWTGTPHHRLFGAIAHLAELWAATHVVVDATGVGAGLASFLKQALGSRVEPFVFTSRSKSDLGWGFLGICNSGRFLDYRDDGEPEWRQFWCEVAAADYQVVDGPERTMRWGVPDPAVHDDLLVSAALCALLERLTPGSSGPSHIVEAVDPLS